MICKLFSRTIFSIGGKHLPFFLVNAIMRELWGRGSGGRAMRSQRIGQGFESPRLHQNGHRKMSVFFCCKSLISPKSLDDAPRGLAGVFRLPALPCGEPPAPSGLTRRRTFVASSILNVVSPSSSSEYVCACGGRKQPPARTSPATPPLRVAKIRTLAVLLVRGTVARLIDFRSAFAAKLRFFLFCLLNT